MSGDEFQSRYASVMDGMLRSAVAETTQLFETMVEELKAEISRITKENDDLKSKCQDFENAKKRPTADIEEREPEPGPSSGGGPSNTRRDTAIQCDLVPLRAMLVERCHSPCRPVSPSVQRQGEHEEMEEGLEKEQCHDAPGEDNPQMAFILIKQEESDCDDHVPRYMLLKQEGGEPTLVRRQIVSEIPDALKDLINCSTPEGLLHAQTSSHGGVAPLQKDQETHEDPETLHSAGASEQSCRRGAQSQVPELENPPVDIPPAVEDKMEDQSEVTVQTPETPPASETQTEVITLNEEQPIAVAQQQSVLQPPEKEQPLAVVQQLQMEGVTSINEQVDATMKPSVGPQGVEMGKVEIVLSTNEQPSEITPQTKEKPFVGPQVEKGKVEIVPPTAEKLAKGAPSTKEKPSVAPQEVEIGIAEIEVSSQPVSSICRRRRRPPMRSKLYEPQQQQAEQKKQSPSSDTPTAQETVKTSSTGAETINVSSLPVAATPPRRRGRPPKTAKLHKPQQSPVEEKNQPPSVDAVTAQQTANTCSIGEERNDVRSLPAPAATPRRGRPPKKAQTSKSQPQPVKETIQSPSVNNTSLTSTEETGVSSLSVTTTPPRRGRSAAKSHIVETRNTPSTKLPKQPSSVPPRERHSSYPSLQDAMLLVEAVNAQMSEYQADVENPVSPQQSTTAALPQTQQSPPLVISHITTLAPGHKHSSPQASAIPPTPQPPTVSDQTTVNLPSTERSADPNCSPATSSVQQISVSSQTTVVSPKQQSSTVAQAEIKANSQPKLQYSVIPPKIIAPSIPLSTVTPQISMQSLQQRSLQPRLAVVAKQSTNLTPQKFLVVPRSMSSSTSHTVTVLSPAQLSTVVSTLVSAQRGSLPPVSTATGVHLANPSLSTVVMARQSIVTSQTSTTSTDQLPVTFPHPKITIVVPRPMSTVAPRQKQSTVAPQTVVLQQSAQLPQTVAVSTTQPPLSPSQPAATVKSGQTLVVATNEKATASKILKVSPETLAVSVPPKITIAFQEKPSSAIQANQQSAAATKEKNPVSYTSTSSTDSLRSLKDSPIIVRILPSVPSKVAAIVQEKSLSAVSSSSTLPSSAVSTKENDPVSQMSTSFTETHSTLKGPPITSHVQVSLSPKLSAALPEKPPVVKLAQPSSAASTKESASVSKTSPISLPKVPVSMKEKPSSAVLSTQPSSAASTKQNAPVSNAPAAPSSETCSSLTESPITSHMQVSLPPKVAVSVPEKPAAAVKSTQTSSASTKGGSPVSKTSTSSTESHSSLKKSPISLPLKVPVSVKEKPSSAVISTQPSSAASTKQNATVSKASTSSPETRSSLKESAITKRLQVSLPPRVVVSVPEKPSAAVKLTRTSSSAPTKGSSTVSKTSTSSTESHASLKKSPISLPLKVPVSVNEKPSSAVISTQPSSAAPTKQNIPVSKASTSTSSETRSSLKESPITRRLQVSLPPRVAVPVPEIPSAALKSTPTSSASTKENPAVTKTSTSSTETQSSLKESPRCLPITLPPRIPAAENATVSKMANLSTESFSTLKESPITGVVQTAVPSTTTEKPVTTALRLTAVVSKDITSDPRSQMTKTQFLAQLAVSPVTQEQALSKDNVEMRTVGTETNISEKKRFVTRLRNRLRPLLQRKKTGPNLETVTKPDATPVVAKKSRLAEDDNPSNPSEPTPVSPNNPRLDEESSSPQKTTSEPTPVSTKNPRLDEESSSPKMTTSEPTPVSTKNPRLDEESSSPKMTTSEPSPDSPKNPTLDEESSNPKMTTSEPTPVSTKNPRLDQESSSPKMTTSEPSPDSPKNPTLDEESSNPKMTTSEPTPVSTKNPRLDQESSTPKITTSEPSPDSPKNPTLDQESSSHQNTTSEPTPVSTKNPRLEQESSTPKITTSEPTPDSPKHPRLDEESSIPKITTSEPTPVSSKNPRLDQESSNPKMTSEPSPDGPNNPRLDQESSSPKITTSEPNPVNSNNPRLDQESSSPKKTTSELTPVSPKNPRLDKESSSPKTITNKPASINPNNPTLDEESSSPKKTTSEPTPVSTKNPRLDKESSHLKKTTSEPTPASPKNPRLDKESSHLKKTTSEPTPVSPRNIRLVKENSSLKRATSEPRALSPKKPRLAKEDSSPKKNSRGHTPASLKKPRLAKESSNPKKSASKSSSLTPKRTRLAKDVASLRKSVRVASAKTSAIATNAKKLVKAANVKKLAKTKNAKQPKSTQNRTEAGKSAKNRANLEVLKKAKAKAVVWTPPRLASSRSPVTKGRSSSLIPAKRGKRSRAQASTTPQRRSQSASPQLGTPLNPSPSTPKKRSLSVIHTPGWRLSSPRSIIYPPHFIYPIIPIKAPPIESPLEPLSVLGRRLLKNQCGECGRVLSSQAALQSHVSLHSGRRPFSCTLCGKNFPDSKGLRRHGRVHRNGRIHKCTVCGKGFVYRFGLTKHLQMVHGRVKPFVCQMCDKGFFTQRDVEAHIRVHTGEKPFHCHLCPKSFKRRVELNVHLRWHNGEKRHWCSYCGKGFLDYNNLKRHTYIHTGEKPHSCPECSKKFTQSGHLKKHLKNVHKVL